MKGVSRQAESICKGTGACQDTQAECLRVCVCTCHQMSPRQVSGTASHPSCRPASPVRVSVPAHPPLGFSKLIPEATAPKSHLKKLGSQATAPEGPRRGPACEKWA